MKVETKIHLANLAEAQTNNLMGLRFEELTVIAYSHSNNSAYWKCKCSCGQERICRGSDLVRGRIKRCKECKKKIHLRGRLRKVKGTTEWVIWQGIKQRCLNLNNAAYKNYGSRGITICDEWLVFANFFRDMGPRPEGLQIDRIDNDKGYCKENCQWVTAKQNSNNRRARNESRNKDSSE